MRCSKRQNIHLSGKVQEGSSHLPDKEKYFSTWPSDNREREKVLAEESKEVLIEDISESVLADVCEDFGFEETHSPATTEMPQNVGEKTESELNDKRNSRADPSRVRSKKGSSHKKIEETVELEENNVKVL